MSERLVEMVTTRDTIVCAGSGGVGKTTTAAVLAMEAARRGRRAVVVTIDPAKRLADTLGIESLSNAPSRIEGPSDEPWPGELWALMLDTKSTFDNLVTTYSETPEQAERILANPFYRNISGALSGTQEYMAGEKLYELHANTDFDLVVVDTPPTRNALDFLDASRRLTRFLDHRLYRMLMAPTRAYMKAVNVAAQAFVRTVGRVVGGEVLDDALAFFQAFEGMEGGFRDRAAAVQSLLTAEETAYVLVASPRVDTVEEAAYFAKKLAQTQLPVEALIVNRMHPRFGEGRAEADRGRAETLAGTAIGSLYANLADFRQMADEEEATLAGIAEQVAPAPLVRVPFLADDVHDLGTLAEIGGHLFAAAE
ncbi:MAG TPA: ArsA-related P-loop ATPase [Acidimicrobiales bacterium]|nr:ArsA-related P-loop ATPase [Acidimicrobiales bacterium]